MHKRLLLPGLLLMLLLAAGAGFARQGCPGPNDPCPPTEEPTVPTDPGTQPTQPTDPGTQPTQENPDRDGDGVPNYVDACPDVAGTGFTDGCPVDAATPVPNNAPIFPISEDCLLGNSQRANIRQLPSTDDAIMGQLNTGEITRGIFRMRDTAGESWYFTDAGGYIRSDVVRTNGNCGDLLQVQPGAALLHLGTGVIDGLRVFPLQRNLNTLNVNGGLAVSPSGELIDDLSHMDIESMLIYIMMLATQDARNDIKEILDEISKLKQKEQQRQDDINATQAAEANALASLDAIATLQAEIGAIMLMQRHGTAADCPMFTKWVEYPPEIAAQLELLTPVEPTAPCMVEILFSDSARPNPTGDGVRPNPTGDGVPAVVLHSILIDVTP